MIEQILQTMKNTKYDDLQDIYNQCIETNLSIDIIYLICGIFFIVSAIMMIIAYKNLKTKASRIFLVLGIIVIVAGISTIVFSLVDIIQWKALPQTKFIEHYSYLLE